MLVANPRKQKLCIQVKDSLGFTDLTIGAGEVNYSSVRQVLAWLLNLFSCHFVIMRSFHCFAVVSWVRGTETHMPTYVNNNMKFYVRFSSAFHLMLVFECLMLDRAGPQTTRVNNTKRYVCLKCTIYI